MKYFAGNIDEKNIEILEKVGAEIVIEFHKGAYMTLSENSKEHHSFYPIFCESKEQAIKLINHYVTAIKNSETNNLSNDLFVVSVAKAIEA